MNQETAQAREELRVAYSATSNADSEPDNNVEFLYKDAMILLKSGHADLITDDHFKAIHKFQQDWLARTANFYDKPWEKQINQSGVPF